MRIVRNVLLTATTLSLLAMVGMPGAEGALIVADNFSYADGVLAGNDGGTAGNPPSDEWANGWTGAGNVSSGQVATTESAAGSRPITTSFVGSASAPLYFSGLFTKTGSNAGYALWLRLNTGSDDSDGNTNPVSIGLADNKFSLRLDGASEAIGDFGSYTSGDQVQVVGKLEFDVSGSNERLTVWVDPTGVETAALTATITGQDLGWTAPSYAHLRNWVGSGGDYLIDDIKIGTTWNAVAVPEPGSFALLLIGSVAFGVLRRRKK